MIHGTQKVEMQITAAINMVKKIPELVLKVFPSSVEAKVLFDSLMNAREIKIREQLLEDVYVLGKTSYDTIMDLEMKSALASYLGYMPTSYHVQVYERLMINSQIYHSLLYTRVTKRNSFSVQWKSKGNKGYGKISWFATYVSDSKTHHVVFIKPFSIKMERTDSQFIVVDSQNSEHNPIICCDVNCVTSKVFHIKIDGLSVDYLVKFPNATESRG